MFSLCIMAILAVCKIFAYFVMFILKLLGIGVNHAFDNYMLKQSWKDEWEDEYIEEPDNTVQPNLKPDYMGDIINNVPGYYVLTLDGNNFIPIARCTEKEQANQLIKNVRAQGKSAVLKVIR